MKVALVVVGDGRIPYLAQALASLDEALTTPLLSRTLVYDEPQARMGAWELARRHELSVVVHTQRLGMAGAVQSAWQAALRSDADYVLHWEEDFVARAPLDLTLMVEILDYAPHLSQLVLKRQAWSPEERAAGGIIERNPDAYTECHRLGRVGVRWVEHREIFSLNPTLIPRRVVEAGWPAGNEAGKTAELNADPTNRFAFLGAKAAPPVVEHIGMARAAGWRL